MRHASSLAATPRQASRSLDLVPATTGMASVRLCTCLGRAWRDLLGLPIRAVARSHVSRTWHAVLSHACSGSKLFHRLGKCIPVSPRTARCTSQAHGAPKQLPCSAPLLMPLGRLLGTSVGTALCCICIGGLLALLTNVPRDPPGAALAPPLCAAPDWAYVSRAIAGLVKLSALRLPAQGMPEVRPHAAILRSCH